MGPSKRVDSSTQTERESRLVENLAAANFADKIAEEIPNAKVPKSFKERKAPVPDKTILISRSRQKSALDNPAPSSGLKTTRNITHRKVNLDMTSIAPTTENQHP